MLQAITTKFGNIHCIKSIGHIEFMAVFVYQVMCILETVTCTFCHTHYFIFAEDFIMHLLQITMNIALHGIILHKVLLKAFGESRKGGVFCCKAKCIEPEPIDTFI